MVNYWKYISVLLYKSSQLTIIKRLLHLWYVEQHRTVISCSEFKKETNLKSSIKLGEVGLILPSSTQSVDDSPSAKISFEISTLETDWPWSLIALAWLPKLAYQQQPSFTTWFLYLHCTSFFTNIPTVSFQMSSQKRSTNNLDILLYNWICITYHKIMLRLVYKEH